MGFRDRAAGDVVIAATILSSTALPPIDASATKEAIDAARKTAATFAGSTGLALVIGAFVGGVGGAIGGQC